MDHFRELCETDNGGDVIRKNRQAAMLRVTIASELPLAPW